MMKRMTLCLMPKCLELVTSMQFGRSIDNSSTSDLYNDCHARLGITLLMNIVIKFVCFHELTIFH